MAQEVCRSDLHAPGTTRAPRVQAHAVRMLRAGPGKDQHSGAEEYAEKTRAMARADFDYVRGVVEYYLSKAEYEESGREKQHNSVSVEEDKKASDAVAYVPTSITTNPTNEGNISVNPEKYANIVVFHRSMWDGFWVLVHELLHKEGTPNLPRLIDDIRMSSQGEPTAPRTDRPHGAGDPGKPLYVQ